MNLKDSQKLWRFGIPQTSSDRVQQVRPGHWYQWYGLSWQDYTRKAFQTYGYHVYYIFSSFQSVCNTERLLFKLYTCYGYSVPSTVVPCEHRGVQTERASIHTRKYVQLVYRSRISRNRSWFATSQIDRGGTYQNARMHDMSKKVLMLATGDFFCERNF